MFIQPLLSQFAYVVTGIVFSGMLNRGALRCAGFFPIPQAQHGLITYAFVAVVTQGLCQYRSDAPARGGPKASLSHDASRMNAHQSVNGLQSEQGLLQILNPKAAITGSG